jgi:hypothetical protein
MLYTIISITNATVMKKARTTIASLNEDLKQNWTRIPNKHYDQFGFIICCKIAGYELYHKGQLVITTHCLNAAKEISRIILNDKIENEGRFFKE